MDMKVINTKTVPAAVGPYSQAIIAGGFLFTSGQIPLDPATGVLVDGGVEASARRVFLNLKQVLTSAGLTFGDVVKTTLFITNMADFACINDIYAEFFMSPYPARSCVEVSKLPKGALLEIEAIALCRNQT